MRPRAAPGADLATIPSQAHVPPFPQRIPPPAAPTQATPMVKAPRTQATNAPATSSFHGILRLAALASDPTDLKINMASLLRSALGWRDIVPGAQTERRGGAGPVGACLAVRTPPAAFLLITFSA